MKILIINLIDDERGIEITKKAEAEYKKTEKNAEIKAMDLGKENYKDCIGCWNCWVKTPGVCIHKDSMIDIYREYVSCNRVVLILDTAQGFISGRSKAFIDRLIPLYHPYITIINGEMMHRNRYDNYPDIDFYFNSSGLSIEEESVVEDYAFRVAYHFRVSARILECHDEELKFKKLEYREAKPEFVKGQSMSENRGKVIIYNGSPRGLKGNSLILAQETVKGLKAEGLNETDYEIRNIADIKSHDLWAEDFENHSRHIFIFPLYVHAMPSIVMKFFEKLKRFSKDVQITFAVQSGFSESAQSYYLRPYLSLLAKRLGAVYGGTLIKGGVEGIQIKPEKSNQKLFSMFNRMGSEIIKKGVVSEELIDRSADPVHLKKGEIRLFKIVELTGLINFYWDMQLKKNGAFKERFAKPYEK